jgi:hypothetical protein
VPAELVPHISGAGRIDVHDEGNTMRLARRLILLTTTILMAAAFMPGAAVGQEEAVEVTNEVSHCTLSAPNCVLHVTGSSSWRLFVFGVDQGIINACNDEFVAVLGENGAGNIVTYNNNANPSSPCTRIKCNDTGENWPITTTGEYTGIQADEGHLTVRFCWDYVGSPGDPGTHCNVELRVENHGSHKYGLRADNNLCVVIPGVADIRINGTWKSEPDPVDFGYNDVEIIH